MYAGSNSGQMYALDATKGNILWNFAKRGHGIDGPSIVDGTLYWGSGYRNILGTGNNKVVRFSLAARRPRRALCDHDKQDDRVRQTFLVVF